jgi:hypothetical protein
MSRKMTKYSTQLKTRLVLEILKEERTLNEYPKGISSLWSGHS